MKIVYFVVIYIIIFISIDFLTFKQTEKIDFEKYELIGCEKYQNIETCQYNDDTERYFKINNNDMIKYYHLTNINVGRGSFGTVYIAKDLDNKTDIVIKKLSKITNNEIECLYKMKLYIGHKGRYILMKKVKGIDYDKILNDQTDKYSDEMLINIHKKIIKKFQNLKDNYINHGDAYPRHIFVEIKHNFLYDLDFDIEIVDYGLCKINPYHYYDICDFNNIVYEAYHKKDKFKNYLENLEIC